MYHKTLLWNICCCSSIYIVPRLIVILHLHFFNKWHIDNRFPCRHKIGQHKSVRMRASAYIMFCSTSNVMAKQPPRNIGQLFVWQTLRDKVQKTLQLETESRSACFTQALSWSFNEFSVQIADEHSPLKLSQQTNHLYVLKTICALILHYTNFKEIIFKEIL